MDEHLKYDPRIFLQFLELKLLTWTFQGFPMGFSKVFLWFSYGFSVEPPSPQTDLRVAAGAAPFNRLCRIYAPRYRQALARWAHSVVCE